MSSFASPISKAEYLGPPTPTTEQGRVTSKMYKLEDNFTPSHDNTHLPLPSIWEKKSEDIQFTEGSKKSINLAATKKILQIFSSGYRHLIQEHSSMITMCAQRRIAAFYQQLILAYGTGLYFVKGETLSQAESCKLRTVKKKQEKSEDSSKEYPVNVPLNATHTSTIPCLYAYKTSKAKNGVIFLMETEAYNFWNSTIAMPSFFNVSIDKTIDITLIPIAISLINQVSKKKITPQQGLMEFVNAFLETVRTKQNSKTPPEQEKLDAKVLGLQLYERELKSIRTILRINTRAFGVLLNFKIYPNESPESHKVLLEIRYQAIQRYFAVQEELFAWIYSCQEIIFEQAKLPKSEKRFFYELIVKRVSSNDDRPRASKLFNLPFRDAESDESKQEADKIKSKKSLLRRATIVLTFVPVKGILSREKREERGAILRRLRKRQGWTQEDLLQKILEKEKKAPLTKEKIQKYERGELWMGTKSAELLSEILDDKKFQQETSVKKILTNMGDILSEQMENQRRDEQKEQGSILRRLRKMRGWTREDLLQKALEKEEKAPLTKEKIQKYERRKLLIDTKSVDLLSKTLDVDPVLFQPQFYYA